jgi:hypothetical protein
MTSRLTIGAIVEDADSSISFTDPQGEQDARRGSVFDL